jgi:hypothetical protein
MSGFKGFESLNAEVNSLSIEVYYLVFEVLMKIRTSGTLLKFY